MDKIEQEIDVQEKIIKIVQTRHEQISEIKTSFDWKNDQLYKGIVPLGENLSKFEKIDKKSEYHSKCENIISLALSIGRIMDLNNSIKTIILSIKIFEEHKNYLNNKTNTDNKSFIAKFFSKNRFIPISQNEYIKQRMKIDWDNSDSFQKTTQFYESLYGSGANFFNDLNNFIALKQEIKNNNDNKGNKKDENNSKLNKIIINSFSAFNKFYARAPIIFEMDYPSIIYSSCDIFYMLYNKMMDNICYNPNFLPYIEELDEYILTYFIKPCLNDLMKISEIIIKDEIEGLNSNLEKLYK